MRNRAVSPVVGLVLLVGLTTVTALSLFVVSASVIDGPRDSAETAQAEQSLAQFADTADRIVRQGGGTAEYRVLGSERGTVAVDESAGYYEVRIERGGTIEVLSSGSLGTYRYLGPDGTVVAYQGGGVWRLDARGRARIVRPPEFHYRAQPEATLTLPVVRLVGNGSDTAPSRGSMRVADQRNRYPRRPVHTNPMDNGTVFIEVESEFCAGWEDFFRQRTDGAVAEACDEGTDGHITVELEVPFHLSSIHDGVWTADYSEGFGPPGSVTAVNPSDLQEGNYDPESADRLVASRADRCDPGDMTSLTGTITGDGLHCTEEIDGDVAVDTDAAGGDVQIFARDGMESGTSIEVTGTGGNVSVYFGGDVEFGGGGGGGRIGNDTDPTQTRLFLNSSADFSQSGTGDSYALLYAPESNVYFQSGGSGDFEGAIIAEDVHVDSASLDIEYYPGFASVEIVDQGSGDPFYYLHVSETTVRVSG